MLFYFDEIYKKFNIFYLNSFLNLVNLTAQYLFLLNSHRIGLNSFKIFKS